MNLNSRKFKTHALIAVLFLLLAVALEGLMYGYWSQVIQPRLYIEAEFNAKILAESQARIISGAITSNQEAITQENINELTDQILVFIDPIDHLPYFLGVSLELDYEVVTVSTQTLELSGGDISCQHCFFVTTALYSESSYEILGIANFALNNVFYEKLKTDIKEVLLIESSIALAALFVVWIMVNFIISKLNFEIKIRKKMTQQLRLAKENAEKANQTKSEFLANMSHEIRTPLNAMVGMNYILFKTSLDKRQKDLLSKLNSSTKLLLSLINDLLDFSKIEAGKLELESTPFTIDEVLNSLAEMVMTKAGEKDIDIIYFTSRDIPDQLIGDPLRLGQILLNLLNNALKFTEQGEILLSVEVIKPLPTKDSDSIFLKFSIKDSGIGIQQEDISKLFHSFMQADNSTTRKFGGTGLGLSICKQLVQQMGGDISVNSTYGQGSTFTFTVNLGIDSASKPIEYALPAIIQHSHVLVVDDNQIAQKIFQHMLDCFGFTVTIASSAKQGIEILQSYDHQSNPIQLILMDAKMPGMNGMEASHLIKTQLDLERVPAIIMVTAYAENLSHTECPTSWDDYLVKPISQSVLYDAIVNIFSSQRTFPAPNTGSSHTHIQKLFSNKQVLLVEDNLTNQEVACALMAELTLQVSIANNGKEAVEVIKSHRFDLIFMDLQMPIMDGFEATRLIRLDKDHQHVPIIAMTAHAMQGDREKCLNAQMDDYITKPIDVDRFFSLLDRWLSKQTHTSVRMIETERKPVNSIPPYPDLPEIKSINIPKALHRMQGKQELLIRLLINFKSLKADIVKKISIAIRENDLQTAKELVHSLKGESGTLEATTLFLATQKLEQQLQENANHLNVNLLDVEQALADVLNDVALLEKTLLKDIDKTHPTESTSLNLETLSLELRELATLLRENNLRAKKLAKTITPQLSHSQYAVHWNKLLEALTLLDFEIAQLHLQALALELKISL